LRLDFGRFFTIQADELLLVRNNAGFNGSWPMRIAVKTGTIDALFQKQGFQATRRIIMTDNSEQVGLSFQGGDVSRDICGPAGHETFAPEFDDWNGCFRRDATDMPPNEMIEHDIADYEHSRGARTIQNIAQAR
jgi:hypothetical protein